MSEDKKLGFSGRKVTSSWSCLANWSHDVHYCCSRREMSVCSQLNSSLVSDVFKTQMSEQMTACDSSFFTETRPARPGLQSGLSELSLTSHVCVPLRPRGHHLSVSAGTRRTPCAVVVGPKPTTCRSLPAASVATPRSARESVSDRKTCCDGITLFL